ncbi:MAG: VOC family protein [Alphaproteobacteria bacterium]
MDVIGLHHLAYRCRNAEETRRFYEDIIGLPLVHVIIADHVPSTGEYCPYTHIFFALKDGSCLAFFDLGDDKATAPDPETPSWVNHVALELASLDEVLAMRDRLLAFGLDVIGPTDHEFVKSIYLFDPNGIRLEFTCRTAGRKYEEDRKAEAHAMLGEFMRRRHVQPA